MLTLFDISALIIASSGAFYFKLNKNSTVILVNLYASFLIGFIDLSHLGQYYYVIISLFEFLFIALGLAVRVKTSILIIFLISLSYNALGFIEFNTNSDIVYNNYSLVMQGAIISLIFLIFKYGIKNGFSDNYSINNNLKSNNYSRFFYWGTQ